MCHCYIHFYTCWMQDISPPVQIMTRQSISTQNTPPTDRDMIPSLLLWLTGPHIPRTRMVPQRSHPSPVSQFVQSIPLTSSLHVSIPGKRWSGACNHRNLNCSVAYLLLYELKQGASIHILAREVSGATEDKGIGRIRRGEEEVVVVVV